MSRVILQVLLPGSYISLIFIYIYFVKIQIYKEPYVQFLNHITENSKFYQILLILDH